MNNEITDYHNALNTEESQICGLLASNIDRELDDAVSKIWHGHPVWFLNENPIVGYSKQKAGIRLMFWSGQDFEEDQLVVHGTKFKDASIYFNSASEVQLEELKRWLNKSKEIQWDYKNLVKRKGALLRLK